MADPFFSILLPTRNRSEIVGEAIRSVLDQSEPDFEVVVSDNDESPDATRLAVAGFDDLRIRYLRTSGRLAMHENWDNAFLHACGRHVLVLEDKIRLIPTALKELRTLLEGGARAVSYPLRFLPDARWQGTGRPVQSTRHASRTVIEGFARFDAATFDLFPRGLDCCVERALLGQLRAGSPTGYLFSHICPDYAFGFLLLSHIDHFHRINQPLAYIPNNWGWSGNYSNGQASYRKDAIIRRFLESVPVAPDDITRHVPVKSECLWINLVLHDFFRMYRRPDHPVTPDWAAYHAFVFYLILIGRRLGADMALERRELARSLRSQSPLFLFRVLWHTARQGMGHLQRRLRPPGQRPEKS